MKSSNEILQSIHDDLMNYKNIHQEEIRKSIINCDSFTDFEIIDQIHTCLLLTSLEEQEKSYLIAVIDLINQIGSYGTLDHFYMILSAIQLFYFYGENLIKTSPYVIAALIGVYVKTNREDIIQTCHRLLEPEVYNSIVLKHQNDSEKLYLAFLKEKLSFSEKTKVQKKGFN